MVDLPFDALRLLLLIAGFYVCMYFVQRTHFSPLVPHNYRTVADVVALLTGPLLLLVLFLRDTAHKSRRSRESCRDDQTPT